MKSQKIRKLTLTRESLRLLEPAQLEVAGAIQRPVTFPATVCLLACRTGELC